jgi:hypothetical protein
MNWKLRHDLLEVVTRKLPEVSEKNHRNTESGPSGFQLELELSQIHVGNFTATVNLLEHVIQNQ